LGLIGGDKELRFDSEYDGKPLEGWQQDLSNMI
jgi:hypothetical protein